MAGHGTKDYGLPTVKMALRYKTRLLRTVPPTVFFPPPEVTSSFVRLELNEKCAPAIRAMTERIAAAAFAQRRKKSLPQVAALFPQLDMEGVFAEAGLPIDVRADGISVEKYIELAKIANALTGEHK